MTESVRFESNADEIAFYQHKLTRSFRKRGEEAVLGTAMSMIVAVSEMLIMVFGEAEGRRALHGAVDAAVTQIAPFVEQPEETTSEVH